MGVVNGDAISSKGFLLIILPWPLNHGSFIQFHSGSTLSSRRMSQKASTSASPCKFAFSLEVEGQRPPRCQRLVAADGGVKHGYHRSRLWKIMVLILPKKKISSKNFSLEFGVSGLSQHDEVQYEIISKFFRILKPFTIYQVSRECRLMSSESKDGTTPLHLQHRSLDLWQLLWRMKTASRFFFPDGATSELHKTYVRI